MGKFELRRMLERVILGVMSVALTLPLGACDTIPFAPSDPYGDGYVVREEDGFHVRTVCGPSSKSEHLVHILVWYDDAPPASPSPRADQVVWEASGGSAKDVKLFAPNDGFVVRGETPNLSKQLTVRYDISSGLPWGLLSFVPAHLGIGEAAWFGGVSSPSKLAEQWTKFGCPSRPTT